ncbi:MAG TPA: TonB-dependent receptor, partial [Rhizomicrobium sp.]
DASDNLKLGLTASTTGRAPFQTELFARGGHDGPDTFETGDPALKMERANSLEGTLRANLGTVHVEGSLWGTHFNHYIYGNLTGLTCTDDGDCGPGDFGDLRELNYAQSNANFWGMEGKADAPVLTREEGTLNANMLADYVQATFSNGGGAVPRIQPWRVGGGLTWNSKMFDVGFLVLGVGARNSVAAFETPTGGYIDVDAHAALRPFPDLAGFEIDLVAHNLTDQVEQDAVAFNKDLVVMPGRDIRIVLRQAL